MDCSMPGLPVHHQLLEFAQTHVLWVGEAVQPPYPLSSPSPPTISVSQHQGFFQWVSSSHQVAKVLELQLQHQSFQWIVRTETQAKIKGLVTHNIKQGCSALLGSLSTAREFFFPPQVFQLRKPLHKDSRLRKILLLNKLWIRLWCTDVTSAMLRGCKGRKEPSLT